MVPVSIQPVWEGGSTCSPKVQAILGGRAPERVVVAGGGKLVNIVVRDA